MPRKEIDLPHRLEYLSILDENGQVDRDLEPDIAPEMLLKLHRAMVLGRRFDERMLTMQRQGRIGTFAPIKGQEASQLGAVAVLDSRDWLVPSFRETAAEIFRGKPMENVLLLFAGYNEGGQIDQDLRNLPIAIPVGSQALHAVGLGYGVKYHKNPEIVMTFFGDGATSEGDFHEALNFAGVFQVPVIFVCQNNQWAISIPRGKQTRAKTLAQKALAYGIPGIAVDGNDILAMYAAAKEAADRARSGGGPTFIESVTYRMSVHTTADDPKRYRTDEEVEEWVRRDPIVRFEQYLKARGLLTDEAAREVDEAVRAEIKAAEDNWLKRIEGAIDPIAMFDGAYAELPPDLVTQREALKRELEAQKQEGQHG